MELIVSIERQMLSNIKPFTLRELNMYSSMIIKILKAASIKEANP